MVSLLPMSSRVMRLLFWYVVPRSVNLTSLDPGKEEITSKSHSFQVTLVLLILEALSYGG